jgi:hypothetical protein
VTWNIVMAGLMLLGVVSSFIVAGHVFQRAWRTGAIGFNSSMYSFRSRPMAAGLIVAAWVALIGICILGFVAAGSQLWEVWLH